MNGLVWCDLETTGLDDQKDHILEVAAVITDVEGLICERFERLSLPMFPTVMSEYIDTLASAPPGTGPKIVYDMHNDSGLWDEVLKNGLHLERVETELHSWLLMHQIEYNLEFKKMPLCGNSVWFDHAMIRSRMPRVNQLFGHRNIDVSSTKELVRKRHPEVMSKWEALTADSTKPHRAMDDILHSIREYQFYLCEGMIA